MRHNYLHQLILLLALFCYTNKSLCEKKPWTFLVYMAADNDLNIFAPRNIKQMKKIGSNEHVNIVINWNKLEKKEKISQTYFIKKDQLDLLYEEKGVDSGNEKTLTSFCINAIKRFPANHYALVFWNHGTGPIDPFIRGKFSPSKLFSFLHTHDRYQAPYLSWYDQIIQKKHRGVCFDDSTSQYLTEVKLDKALNIISQNGLEGKKFDLVCFDACLMAMVEIASIVYPYAHIMVASQEVELGAGWNYARVLAPFLLQSVTPSIFAKHIVYSYKKTYDFTDDFTHSAIDLDSFSVLEKNIYEISTTILKCLKTSIEPHLRQALAISRSKHTCTSFDEPDYIDLHHFSLNLIKNLIPLKNKILQTDLLLIDVLIDLLYKNTNIIKKLVIANTTGAKHVNAQGLSIYFPEHTIHSSYRNTAFATTTAWTFALSAFLGW